MHDNIYNNIILKSGNLFYVVLLLLTSSGVTARTSKTLLTTHNISLSLSKGTGRTNSTPCIIVVDLNNTRGIINGALIVDD